ncbi:MAG: hypothetical protein ACREQ5_05255 [Candidatus Dormibacteria bacterium]
MSQTDNLARLYMTLAAEMKELEARMGAVRSRLAADVPAGESVEVAPGEGQERLIVRHVVQDRRKLSPERLTALLVRVGPLPSEAWALVPNEDWVAEQLKAGADAPFSSDDVSACLVGKVIDFVQVVPAQLKTRAPHEASVL